MSQPTITVIDRDSCRTRFRAVGEPTAADWKQSRRPQNEPWCEFSIWHAEFGKHYMPRLSSYGGELWPSAWPELFDVGPRTIYGQSTSLTNAGLAAINAAMEASQ